MIYVECPNRTDEQKLSLFLAGGLSGCRHWQIEVIQKLSPLDIVLYNPRRKYFDITDSNVAEEQIIWEEEMIRRADVVSFYFCRESVCPITLYELGVCNTMRFKAIIIGMDHDYSRRFDVEVQTRLKNPRTAASITYGLESFTNNIIKFFKNIT